MFVIKLHMCFPLISQINADICENQHYLRAVYALFKINLALDKKTYLSAASYSELYFLSYQS